MLTSDQSREMAAQILARMKLDLHLSLPEATLVLVDMVAEFDILLEMLEAKHIESWRRCLRAIG